MLCGGAGTAAATNASGIATASFKANAAAGTYAVTAKALAGANPTASFNLTNNLPAGARLLPITPLLAGVSQNGRRFQVRMVGRGRPIAGVAVTFTVPAEFGSFDGLTTITVVTDARGFATSPLLLPTMLRRVRYTMLAQAGSLVVRFRPINVFVRMTRV